MMRSETQINTAILSLMTIVVFIYFWSHRANNSNAYLTVLILCPSLRNPLFAILRRKGERQKYIALWIVCSNLRSALYVNLQYDISPLAPSSPVPSPMAFHSNCRKLLRTLKLIIANHIEKFFLIDEVIVFTVNFSWSRVSRRCWDRNRKIWVFAQ